MRLYAIPSLFSSVTKHFYSLLFHVVSIQFRTMLFLHVAQQIVSSLYDSNSVPDNSVLFLFSSLHILTFPLLCLGSQLSHHSFDTSKSLSLLISNINCCSNSGILSESRLSASSIKIGSLTSFIFWNPLTISASHRILSP